MSERLDVLFSGGKRVNVQIREFEITTDQSIKAGGEASAPEPFDLFLASMAACAGIYALNFCQSRNIPTEGLALGMEWDRDTQKPLEAKVRYRLTLPTDFPDEYRSSITRAMELCAVKKHIQTPPEFTIEIVEQKKAPH